jgi:branched-chain amino acid transport system permease protein
MWYQQHYELIVLMLLTAVGAMGYQVPLRSGVMAFISAGFWGVGAYAAAKVALDTGLGLWFALGLSLVFGALGGLVLSVLFIRLSGLALAMATFAWDLVVSILAAQFGSFTGGSAGLAPIPALLSMPVLLSTFCIACLVLSRLEVGRLGRAQAVHRYDTELAVSLGINVTAWRHTVFVAAGILGSLSGAIYALSFYEISPSQIGFDTLVSGLATVVVGGFSSWRGCLLGTIVVIGIPNLFQSLQLWTPVVYGGLLVLGAVFLPDGLLGIWQRRSVLTAFAAPAAFAAALWNSRAARRLGSRPDADRDAGAPLV